MSLFILFHYFNFVFLCLFYFLHYASLDVSRHNERNSEDVHLGILNSKAQKSALTPACVEFFVRNYVFPCYRLKKGNILSVIIKIA